MHTVLFVVQIILAVLLIGIIIMQRNTDDGLSGLSGGGSGGGNAFLSGRASANLLTRTTAILAALFMLNSLLLANLATRMSGPQSILDTETSKSITPEKSEEKAPSVPVAQ